MTASGYEKAVKVCLELWVAYNPKPETLLGGSLAVASGVISG